MVLLTSESVDKELLILSIRWEINICGCLAQAQGFVCRDTPFEYFFQLSAKMIDNTAQYDILGNMTF